MEKSLHEKLVEYSDCGRLAFHMPGHKRRGFESCPPLAAAASIDITEIDGFDDLHRPEGVILATERKAEQLYNSKRCFISTNGSTAAILAAIRTAAITGAPLGKNKIAIARNCHKSVYNGVELCRLTPCYVMPSMLHSIGVYGSVSPFDAQRVFEQNPGICALVITSPTYEGVISDIEGLSRTAHENGALLIVDEAHGSHLPFLRDEGISTALQYGADMVIHSFHKTLSTLTQGAAVQVGKNSNTDISLLARQMSVFNTSSPSYPIMASIDYCFEDITNNHGEKYTGLLSNMKAIHAKFELLEKLEVLKKQEGIYGLDRLKTVISTVNTDIDGYELCSILRHRYDIECESADMNHVIAMAGEGTEPFELEALADGLLDIDARLEYRPSVSQKTFVSSCPEAVLCPADAMEKPSVICSCKDSVGQVAAEYLWLYPPGIPFLVPGERITHEAVLIMENYSHRTVSQRCTNGFDMMVKIIK